ncbi:MAG TPA: hypothetical protein VGM64_13735 [Lacunisphaera sp.]|jgi:hypothetical protein
MNTAFLFFANTVLLARLFVLFKDDAVDGRPWLIKALVELGVLAFFYPLSPVWFGTAAVALAANFAGWRWETKARRKKNLGRLFLGLIELIGLSFFFVSDTSMSFHSRFDLGGWVMEDFSALAPLARLAVSPHFQLKLAGLLLAGNEANLAIRAVFDLLDLKPRALPAGQGVIDLGEFNRGRVIGVLERVLLYWFIMEGQLGAIGFVLAAKAFTRFKALDDRPFAEYVLIGTLLSACLALTAAGLIKSVLG